jgi:hypothetical protein
MEQAQLNEGNNSQDEIDRLRREIERLSQAELGRNQASSSQPIGGSSASARIAPVAALPPRRPKKDLTVKEQPSSPPAADNRRKRKCISFAIGIIFLVGAVVGVLSLVKFMKDKNVSFVRDEGGNRLVSSQELASHNSAGDCWVALHGDVYDLTAYAKRHPGGSSWITDLAGTDGTQSYSDFHSAGLLRSVQGNKLGPLDSTSTTSSNSSANSDNSNSGNSDSGNIAGNDSANNLSSDEYDSSDEDESDESD